MIKETILRLSCLDSFIDFFWFFSNFGWSYCVANKNGHRQADPLSGMVKSQLWRKETDDVRPEYNLISFFVESAVFLSDCRVIRVTIASSLLSHSGMGEIPSPLGEGCSRSVGPKADIRRLQSKVLRFSFIKDRRLKATVFYGGCDGWISSGRANLAAAATAFRRLRIHLATRAQLE